MVKINADISVHKVIKNKVLIVQLSILYNKIYVYRDEFLYAFVDEKDISNILNKVEKDILNNCKFKSILINYKIKYKDIKKEIKDIVYYE